MNIQIPNMPQGKVTKEDGTLSDSFSLFLSQLLITLQTVMSNNGLIAPSQPTTAITQFNGKPNLNGAFIYDDTANAMKVNINGTFKTITVS